MTVGYSTLVEGSVVRTTEGSSRDDVVSVFSCLEINPNFCEVGQGAAGELRENWNTGQRAQTVLQEITLVGVDVIAPDFCPCFLKDGAPDCLLINTLSGEHKSLRIGIGFEPHP